MARLAVAAPLSSMVRTIRIFEVVALWWSVLVVVGMAGILHMANARLFLPHVRLVRICVDVGDDGGGGVRGRV